FCAHRDLHSFPTRRSSDLSKSDHLVYEDRDFKKYHWDQSKYNRVREGDFFLYRRPQKASEIKNQFYLYGAGRIAKIIAPNDIPRSEEHTSELQSRENLVCR